MLRTVLARTTAIAARASRASSSVPAWATWDTCKWSGAHPAVLKNLVGGKWTDARATLDVPDPMNGDVFVKMPNTSSAELGPFIDSLKVCERRVCVRVVVEVGAFDGLPCFHAPFCVARAFSVHDK
jgi:hypothetical protein